MGILKESSSLGVWREDQPSRLRQESKASILEAAHLQVQVMTPPLKDGQGQGVSQRLLGQPVGSQRCPEDPFAPGSASISTPASQCPPPGPPTCTDVRILAVPGWSRRRRPAVPPPARSPWHLPAPPAAQRSLACWGRGLGRGSAPVAVGTVAGGACAEGPGAERCRRTRALGRRRGRGTVRQVRGHEFAPTFLPEAVPALEPRPRRAGLRTLFMIPARIPGVSPRLWLGSLAMDTDRPPGLRPQEPNAARELRRRTVFIKHLQYAGCQGPSGEASGNIQALVELTDIVNNICTNKLNCICDSCFLP
ncbi:uncharacterized protein LOC132532246 [Lagenorhynchus albirostris]|uniref:uncharacterized protein LOC132532246 n=1 Tax=Lagenorhynchus albirostris TaxID=27610 RepID=UPI0028EAD616|nr:uncharacterized protein LOC132532246 [Lagenorhynchus albirostris]